MDYTNLDFARLLRLVRTLAVWTEDWALVKAEIVRRSEAKDFSPKPFAA